jgi:putative membrane protein
MIDYDGRAWLAIFLRIRGSVVPRLLPRSAIAAAIGVVAVLLLEQRGLKIPTLAHTLVGVALGLLLVFRTNASYDRYWEGRRLIGAIVNRSRDLARQAAAYIEGAEARAAFRRLIPAFYWLAAQTLRRSAALGRAEQVLTSEQCSALEGVVFRAPVATRWMTEVLREEATAGRLSEQRLQLLDTNLTALSDALGGAERILKTPIPFAYAQHIKIFVVLFCFSAPFAMVEVMGWATPAASGLLALALFGVDEIGVEIEDPFGDDPNDLPLDAIGQGIEAAVGDLLR